MIYRRSWYLGLMIALLFSLPRCGNKEKPFNEADKLFHGAPDSQGVSGLSFALYKDGRYLVMNSGGIGASYYAGTYSITGDTIVLNDLNDESSLKSNRLLIFRYSEQDSSYWKWKYSESTVWTWDQMKERDSLFGEGDVYQLNKGNVPIKEINHFIIALDSLRNYP